MNGQGRVGKIVSADNLCLLREILVGNHGYSHFAVDSADAAAVVVVVVVWMIVALKSMLLDDFYRSFAFEFR